ncbi:hypothetical protein NUH88_06680 [Nisaea acidiphila]|uniref:Uncharacterized protein n=1 Tax=Nisaea acidiphila TaxID=1862145 RepID=A0A9J7AW80_9PROT|nr:hypothetical protein [Nisaea acidiphila]UUX51374.1 hypothetical protein NUH88_06680 [Nisaea acidiphila]
MISIEELDEAKGTNLAAKAGWAFFGQILAAPVGLFVGAALVGNGKQVCFGAELTDGRFIEQTGPATFSAPASIAQASSFEAAG